MSQDVLLEYSEEDTFEKGEKKLSYDAMGLTLEARLKGVNGWALRLQIKPMVTWIWGGCALMALGGALAASDRRYRARKTATETLPAVAA